MSAPGARTLRFTQVTLLIPTFAGFVIQTFCLVLWLRIVRSEMHANWKLLPVALFCISLGILFWTVLRKHGIKLTLLLGVCLSCTGTFIFQLAAFGRYPGLAKGIEVGSVQHLVVTGVHLCGQALFHGIEITSLFLVALLVQRATLKRGEQFKVKI